jgi:hypothetical protein
MKAVSVGRKRIRVRLIDVATSGREVADAFAVKERVRRRRSSVTISGHFRGDVASRSTRCKSDRKVILKKRRPGEDPVFGHDRTNRRGTWKVRRPSANGRFYAKIEKNRRCGRDVSPTSSGSPIEPPGNIFCVADVFCYASFP